MQITFFKNKSHFYKKRHLVWDNARKAESKPLFRYTALFLSFAAALLLGCLPLKLWLFLVLPIHELCHALYCWLSGKKVERICFFPYKNIFKAIAYVQPKFDLWNKKQRVFFVAFPLLILTVLPICSISARAKDYFILYCSV